VKVFKFVACHWGDLVFVPLFLGCAYITEQIVTWDDFDEPTATVLCVLCFLFFLSAAIRLLASKLRVFRDFVYVFYGLLPMVAMLLYILSRWPSNSIMRMFRPVAFTTLSITMYGSLICCVIRIVLRIVKRVKRKRKKQEVRP
jgi:Na+-transporting NADH:ubiquinone oxidoreductase subunit NqrB